jgi:hypothetical protein
MFFNSPNKIYFQPYFGMEFAIILLETVFEAEVCSSNFESLFDSILRRKVLWDEVSGSGF